MRDDLTTLVKKTWLPHSSEGLNRIWVVLASFLHYTDTKMCLSGEELNNYDLGHNRNMINGYILLRWELEGSVGQLAGNLHFFLFCQHLPIKFICQHPQSNLLQPPSNSLWPRVEVDMNTIQLSMQLSNDFSLWNDNLNICFRTSSLVPNMMSC